MTPKIVTRLANIAAKLAGSDKYDPTIEPVTAFEYYLDKGVDKILAIKGVPAVEAGDKGKVLSVSSSGAPVWENREPLVVTFSGTTENGDAACNHTWEEISAVITAGRPITVQFDSGRINTLNVAIWAGGLQGTYIDISDPTNPGDSYTRINCLILNSGIVTCEFTEV